MVLLLYNIIFSISVLDRVANDNPMCVDSRAGYDGRVLDLHPQPHLLALGRFLHHLHRAGRVGLHDPVGRQPGLYIYD